MNKVKNLKKRVPAVVRYSYRNEICTAHDCIYMDDVEQKFVEKQSQKPFI